MERRIRGRLALLLPLLLPILQASACQRSDAPTAKKESSGPVSSKADMARMADDSDGADWAGYGRTFGEQHYSPLAEINADTIGRLRLAWSLDLPDGNAASVPIAVDGTVYTSTGYSIVRAIDGATGKLKWTYDPQAAQAAGPKLREGWGSRGLAYWNGRIYVGTHDGRLIAIDAANGKPVWTEQTTEPGDMRFISGAPRLFDGKVIIGHGGADGAATRGYVTAYDAGTGRQLWRFYTVPGDPAKGFENKAMAVAAKTWSGQWWKYGGGGTAWNAMSYDPVTNMIIIGTGNGSPWNHRIRSEGKGDNLFLSSIIGLDANTGAYKWHYQTNPGESWDYNATMDMAFADLTIDGKPRHVLMTAPKNGFFYVIDRTNGQLVSARPIETLSWATGVDPKTGRPIERPDLRYPDGRTFTLRPGPTGAHSWQPMAYSPKARLVFIPVLTSSATYSDKGIDARSWKRFPGNAIDGGVNVGFVSDHPEAGEGTSSLLAWDPVAQKAVWRLPTPGPRGGGVMATAGDLVFQGQLDSRFVARNARTGNVLWSFDGQAPMIGAPITYRAGGRQFVTVLAGMGTSTAAFGPQLTQFGLDARSQPRRVLTFVLDGKASLPAQRMVLPPIALDPDFRENPAMATTGAEAFGRRCGSCHGVGAISGGMVPDLRRSAVPVDKDSFVSVVRDGALEAQGMPKFGELSGRDLEDMRYYIRLQAKIARDKQGGGKAPSTTARRFAQ